MIPRPVKRHREPVYPTRLAVLDDPDLLLRHVPGSWRRNAAVMGALAALLATQSCAPPSAKSRGPTRPLPATAVVAPVFVHGEGRGMTGCVVSVPPVFLSEEEALVVITEELSKAGVKMTGRNVVLEGTAIPRRYQEYVGGSGGYKTEIREYPGKEEPLNADLVDGEHGVAVEYVASYDYALTGEPDHGSTLRAYDLQGAARWVGEKVAGTGKGMYLATFYDPTASPGDQESWGKDWQKANQKARDESKRLLRLQVKDFVDWLKGQGAI